MFSKADANRVMEKTDSRGARVPCHIKYCTAVRHAWKLKQKLRKDLALLSSESEEFKALEERITKIHVGGRWVEHDQAVLRGDRGMHAKKKKESVKNLKNPNLYTNSTRNFQFLPGDQIRQAHLSLITQVNHTPVLY